jgi:DNA repair exonuclease SbcCD ATPase subunit
MSLHQDAELKKAVLDLPQKEKDKLLVRLISKDKMLIKQLHFQLLENAEDLEERIEKLRKQLRNCSIVV